MGRITLARRLAILAVACAVAGPPGRWLVDGARAGVMLEPASLARGEEPLELEAGELPELLGLAPGRGYGVFAWDEGEFVPVLTQVDERGPKDGLFEEDDRPDELDANDLLIFMQEDVGDRVGREVWLEGAAPWRYELELADPIHDDAFGWVYVFLGDSLSAGVDGGRSGGEVDDYVHLVSFDPFTIESDRYLERFAPGNPALLVDLVVGEELGGNGQDLYDRVKYRAKTGPLLPWLTENDGWVTYKGRSPIDGPVRVVNSFFVALGDLLDMMEGTVSFYRQMVIIETTVHQLIFPKAAHMVWLGDANPEVKDLRYFSDSPVSPDSVDGSGQRDVGPAVLWHEWVSPTAGSALILQDVLTIPGTAHDAYYCDGCDEERWPETGDGVQWGQWGTWVHNLPFGATIPTETWNVWLSPSLESRGAEWGERFRRRTQRTVRWQERDPVVGITDPIPPPSGLGLEIESVAPNPFNPHTTITFRTSGAHVRLRVFDLSGGVARVLVDGLLNAGTHRRTFDGRDAFGRPLASGTYVIRLETDEGAREHWAVLLR